MVNRLLLYLLVFFFLLSAFVAGAFSFLLSHRAIDFSALEKYHTGKPTILLDDQGKEWTRFQLDKREPASIHEMPKHLINAFIAAEDWHFFSHTGISWRGIIRSTCMNIYNGRIVQGASTITQQLVKLLFFDSRRTFSRKIKEQLMALLVEYQFTKEQIMQTYLNHIYFGCGIYGVQAASQRFWGKSVDTLSIAQVASLAGVVCSPNQFCPLLCPLSNQQRRNHILQNMQQLGFITQTEYQYALSEQIELIKASESQSGLYVKEMVRTFLEKKIGKYELYTGGYVVQTTLNVSMQQAAEKVFIRHCKKLDSELKMHVDGGLITIDSQNGYIKALVGGRKFGDSPFNRAIHARRQIGSVIKPLIYAAALEKGFKITDIELDERIELPQENGQIWAPKNYDSEFEGPITRLYALSHSNNIVTIKTMLQIGASRIIELAKLCQLHGPFHEYPSLALGCIDASLYETIGLFNIFANKGRYVEPYVIQWIKDKWGKKIYRAHKKNETVLRADINDTIASVLRLGLERIKPWFNPWISCDAISKTGTTNDSRTCWFAGSTPNYTTAIYIGPDDNSSMGKNVYPIKTAFPIWLNANLRYTQQKKQFSWEPTLKKMTINERTGKPAAPGIPESVQIMA